MRPEERDRAYLADMRLALIELRSFVGASSEQEFMDRRDLQIITERLLEVIGEIAHHLSESFTAAHPEIDWTKDGRPVKHSRS